MSKPNANPAVKVEQWDIARVLPYAGNADLSSVIDRSGQLQCLLFWWCFYRSLQFFWRYQSSVDHRMVVWANGYQIVGGVSPAPSLRKDVVGVDDFRKSTQPALETIPFPCSLSSVDWSVRVILSRPLYLLSPRNLAALFGACSTLPYAIGRCFKRLAAYTAYASQPDPVGVIRTAFKASSVIVAAGWAAVFSFAEAFHSLYPHSALDAGELPSAFPKSSGIVAGDEFSVCLFSTTALA